MATTGPNLGQIEYEALGVNYYTALKALLRALDGLVQPSVKDKDLTAPPVSPANGDRYLVAGTATGDWVGHENDIARYQSSDGTGWEFFAPSEGWQTYVQDEDAFYRFDGSAWSIPVSSGAQPLDAELTALAGLTSAADKMPYFTGSGTAALADVSAAARTVLDDASVAAMLATMGGAPLASPTFTGTPAAPTAAPGTNTTQLATTAFVEAAVVAGGGAATLQDLTDVSPTATDDAADGDSLTFDSGSGLWVPAAISGGSTLPQWIVGHPDTPPASGQQTEDDEFESTTLNAKWTQALTGSATADIHTTQKSHYWAKLTASNQGVEIRQNAPTGTGTFSMTAKLYMGLTAGGSPQTYIMAQDAAVSNAIYAKLYWSGSQRSISLLKDAAGSFTDNGPTDIGPETTHYYVHIQRKASNVWEVWGSQDGRAWWRVSQQTLSFTVDKIGFGCSAGSSMAANAMCGMDWFRRDWLTL